MACVVAIGGRTVGMGCRPLAAHSPSDGPTGKRDATCDKWSINDARVLTNTLNDGTH